MEYGRISERSVREWYICRSFWVVLLGLISVGLGLGILMIETSWDSVQQIALQVILFIPIAIYMVLIIIYAYVLPIMQYRNWEYRVNNNMIEVNNGVIFKHRRSVPFVRLQHIEIFRGVTDRIFKMSTVIVFTAGGAIRIPNMECDKAEELVASLKVLVGELDKETAND